MRLSVSMRLYNKRITYFKMAYRVRFLYCRRRLNKCTRKTTKNYALNKKCALNSGHCLTTRVYGTAVEIRMVHAPCLINNIVLVLLLAQYRIQFLL